MRRFVRMVGLGLAGLVLAGTPIAQAEDSADYARSGSYLALGFSYGFEMFGDARWGDSKLAGRGAPGVDGRIGYRMFPMFALEGQVQSFIGAELNNSAFGFEMDSTAFTANGKFLPLSGRIQPYALAGIGWVRTRAREARLVNSPRGNQGNIGETKSYALRFAGGIDTYLTEHIVAYAELSYLLAPEDLRFRRGFEGNRIRFQGDYLPLSVGLQYRF